VFKQANRDAAKVAAEKSFVLLKNEHDTLPINKSIDEIAVVGGLANNKAEMNSNWNGDAKPEDPITVVEALKQKFPRKKVRFESGCDPKCDSDSGFAAAVDAAKHSDFTIVVVGESSDMSGEAASRSNIDLPGRQLDLIKAIHATGKPYAVVLINGRPLTINWIAENSPRYSRHGFPERWPDRRSSIRCSAIRIPVENSDHISTIGRTDPDFL
jgi:beta-glucosidase